MAEAARVGEDARNDDCSSLQALLREAGELELPIEIQRIQVAVAGLWGHRDDPRQRSWVSQSLDGSSGTWVQVVIWPSHSEEAVVGMIGVKTLGKGVWSSSFVRRTVNDHRPTRRTPSVDWRVHQDKRNGSGLRARGVEREVLVGSREAVGETCAKTNENKDPVGILLPATGHLVTILLYHFRVHVEDGP
ncbi:hypothetical protein BGW80DRAFT_1255395 [Lactifluus volemus]|nr:hypothetical protein BGW80DRAFT_1255395 [Lactifluus volemus]